MGESIEDVRVYWAPGHASCVAVKDYLTRRGVAYVAIDVQQDPEALRALGPVTFEVLPVVARGDRHIVGLDLDHVDDLLDLPHDPARVALPPDVLVERITGVLGAALRYAHQLPPEHLDDATPGHDRTYRGLVGHVVGHPGRFLALARTPAADHSDVEAFAALGQPDEALGVDALADLAANLADGIRSWWAARPDVAAVVATFYGPQTVHRLLEANTYAVVQHTRQLMDVVRILGREPDGPLGEDQYRGLRLPDGVWDDAPA